jgi:ubiquinone/menaquinone biosynthesis C-methylase UbiE
VTESEHDAVVRRSFEKQVGLFAGEHSPVARRPASALAWVEPLDPDMIVLDVGCGAGHVAEQIAPHVRQVVGVDLTPALLAVGAKRLRDAGIANVLLQEGNAGDLPFVDESFDLVVSRGALHHMPRPEQALAEIARVCRPGGRVVASDMVAPSADSRIAFDDLHRVIDPSHAGVLLDVELAEMLRSTAGPLGYGESTEPITLPVDHMLTDVADRDAVMTALQSEIDGGPPTGFNPVLDDDGRVLVSFVSTVVYATRDPSSPT